ncbi:2-isopropylmalate synthase [Microtetraspora niveoalba]|uniref:2-isopropylmalate synthase n=1 Tax=Microtetraspora niveoalba TaxID=46175 RepID=UPI000833E3D6|nr:2-isopropylmalate synthase [Microtetraspora niveoalba]
MEKTNALGRYRAPAPVPLPGRRWPDNAVTHAPRWLSTDLRDGNQSLASPMSPARKAAMFDLLVRMGYKEIEVGFPAASQDDHDFVRRLIEGDRIPDDVRISVLTQARADLITATVKSLAGAARANVHIYNATSPLFRRLVFRMGRDECRDLAVQATRLLLGHAEGALADCDLGLQYSPEMFNDTELDFSLEVCEAVMDVWQPGPGREVILNFPTTVERTTPNVFADQIEWLDRNLSRREHVCLSVHPHNDRGTGVASAELALMAGAQRIEGCLLGNGERAGNVDLVTLGMNLFSHGVDPGIDFSDLNTVRRTVELCTGLPVHPRHPYAGDLVYTAFSGSHQDAIKKGFDALELAAAQAGADLSELPWEVPYLPVDPADVGRTYEALVRVNSQSGKGGVAYVLSAKHGLHLPRDLQIDFARVVQRHSDATGTEIPAERIAELFEQSYVGASGLPVPLSFGGRVIAHLHVDGQGFDTGGDRVDVVEALRATLAARGVDVRTVNRTGVGARGGDRVAVYAECHVGSVPSGAPVWGVGFADDVEIAALRAVSAAADRAAAGSITLDPAADAQCEAPLRSPKGRRRLAVIR